MYVGGYVTISQPANKSEEKIIRRSNTLNACSIEIKDHLTTLNRKIELNIDHWIIDHVCFSHCTYWPFYPYGTDNNETHVYLIFGNCHLSSKSSLWKLQLFDCISGILSSRWCNKYETDTDQKCVEFIEVSWKLNPSGENRRQLLLCNFKFTLRFSNKFWIYFYVHLIPKNSFEMSDSSSNKNRRVRKYGSFCLMLQNAILGLSMRYGATRTLKKWSFPQFNRYIEFELKLVIHR